MRLLPWQTETGLNSEYSKNRWWFIANERNVRGQWAENYLEENSRVGEFLLTTGQSDPISCFLLRMGHVGREHGQCRGLIEKRAQGT